jgi:mannose-6-phosphate isomerase-like protein (cupin superfamily)
VNKLDAFELTKGIKDDWTNFVVSEINDHVVRLSVLQRDFHWHAHSASDEMFFVVAGKLYVDFEDHTEELAAGQMVTVQKGVRHRTRSIERTLVLCFESASNDVVGDS